MLQARLERPELQVLLAPLALLGLIEPRKLREVPVLLPLLVLRAAQGVQLWRALYLPPRKLPGSMVRR